MHSKMCKQWQKHKTELEHTLWSQYLFLLKATCQHIGERKQEQLVWDVQRGETLTHSYDTDQVTKQIHTCHGCISNLYTELSLGQLRQFNQQSVNEQEIRGKVISCHTRTHDSRKCTVGNSVFNYIALTKASECRGIMFSFSSDCDQC